MFLRTTGLIAAICLLSVFYCQAQTTIIQRFGQDAVNSVEGTEKLAILEFQNLHGYAVQDLTGKKDISEYPDALEVAPLTENTPPLTVEIIQTGFELFAYDFALAGRENQYYRVGDTGILLILYSTKNVKDLYYRQNLSE